MKCLTTLEFENWCETRGIEVPLSGAVNFKTGKNLRVITEMPVSVRERKSTLREIFTFFEKDSGFFVQLRCWNEFSMDAGIVEFILALRRQHGEPRTLSESPVHFFSNDEVKLCLGFLDLVVAFDWEAVWVPANTCNVIWSHVDEHLILVSKEQELIQSITKQMTATGTVFQEF